MPCPYKGTEFEGVTRGERRRKMAEDSGMAASEEKMMAEAEKVSSWFFALLEKMAPQDLKIEGTPEEMIRKAARKSFLVSAGFSAVPGPLGLATIIPEVARITQIQVDLIYRIAGSYGKREAINQTLLALIFGHALGVSIGTGVVRKMGAKIVIQTMEKPAIQRILRRLGMEMAAQVSERVAGRWVSVLTAPLFGAFSYSMTRKIGDKSQEFFAAEIEMASQAPVERREGSPQPAGTGA